MLIGYWIVAGLLATAMLAAGSMKLIRSKEQLHAAGMRYVEDFSATQVKLIGAAEVLGALGLVLPMLTGIAPVLSPVAAAALLVIMVGASAVHVRRAEPPVPGIVLGLLAAAAAVLGTVVLLG